MHLQHSWSHTKNRLWIPGAFLFLVHKNHPPNLIFGPIFGDSRRQSVIFPSFAISLRVFFFIFNIISRHRLCLRVRYMITLDFQYIGSTFVLFCIIQYFFSVFHVGFFTCCQPKIGWLYLSSNWIRWLLMTAQEQCCTILFLIIHWNENKNFYIDWNLGKGNKKP